MGSLRLVLGDQLSRSLSSLRDVEDGDVILMAEVYDEATYVRHHKKKIAFLFSAMRHFAEDLKNEGFTVDYIKLDDKDNSGSFTGEVRRALKRHELDHVIVAEPGEWRVMEMMRSWQDDLDAEVDIRTDDRFFSTLSDFEDWAEGRSGLRMEYFYREMRKKTGYLMEGDKPEGGKWNFDKQNREALPENLEIPERPVFEPDDITKDVLKLVSNRFDNHFGDLEPFSFPVTREDALKTLAFFVHQCLPDFGDYQDAMQQDEPYLFHSLLSFCLNSGLLLPKEVCDMAQAAWRSGDVPLNAVEGFIRQILGWREYIRGLYWLKMPDYKETNALQAKRKLPDFYWTGETDMNCLRQAITQTKQNAYAHHIQRLMVTGNFALLCGFAPDEVNEWYLIVYADAYEWVELPNTHGMALYADGGVLASKPYAASGSYIDKMSNYCQNCSYDVKKKNGEKACPFNYLYWNFLIENQERLKDNHRMGMIYSTLGKMNEEKVQSIQDDSRRFLDSL
jgi:deoxyribodipyrimidine photolyase-related protein